MLPSNSQNSSNSQILGSRALSPNSSRTPSRNDRTHRIFKQTSPIRQSAQSPPQKMASSATTNYNSRMQSISPQGCSLYYRQGHGISVPQISSFRSALSPQKLSLIKSSEVLEYQNSLLRKQLQQRDDVISMYKNGWSPNSVPINDSIIKNLNLRLAQKNVVIQQVHRNLVEFQEIITKDKIQISPICHQRFKILMELILAHQHYPILIRERVVETSKTAEKVIIREDTTVQEWQIKMERSYKQLTTLKQKLQWFEKQNSALQVTIAGLRGQKQNPNTEQIANYKLQIQKLTNQITLSQQQLSGYKDKISSLQILLQNMKHTQPQPNQRGKQKQSLILQRNQLKRVIQQLNIQINSLKNNVQNLSRSIEGYKKGQSQLIIKINGLIEELKIERQKNITVYKDCGHNEMIEGLNGNIRMMNIRIKQLQDQNRINLQQLSKWKGHLKQAQDYITKLQIQLNQYKRGQMRKSQTQLEYKRIDAENSRLSEEISILLISIEKLKQETNLLKTQQIALNGTVQQYQIKIKEHAKQIQILINEKNSDKAKWETLLSSKERQYIENMRMLQDQLKQAQNKLNELRRQLQRNKSGQENINKAQSKIRQYEITIADLRRQIQSFKNDQNRLRQSQNIISDLRRQIQGLQNQLQSFRKYEITIRQNETLIISLKKQIDNMKIEIDHSKKSDSKVKQLENAIADLKRQLQAVRNDISSYESKKHAQIAKIRSQYEAKIAQLQKEIQSQKSQKQWQSQIFIIKQDYEKKIKQLWQKLAVAQEHIFKSQQLTRSQISIYEESIDRLSTQNQNLKKGQQNQYHYKLDGKYALIQKKLVELSGKNVRSVQAQSQYWQKYRMERKRELQEVQGCINEMLVSLSNIQQTVVVRRDQLYRLDLVQLENVLSQINQLKSSKSQSNNSVRQSLQTKFYGILKSVSTKIAQQ